MCFSDTPTGPEPSSPQLRPNRDRREDAATVRIVQAHTRRAMWCHRGGACMHSHGSSTGKQKGSSHSWSKRRPSINVTPGARRVAAGCEPCPTFERRLQTVPVTLLNLLTLIVALFIRPSLVVLCTSRHYPGPTCRVGSAVSSFFKSLLWTSLDKRLLTAASRGSKVGQTMQSTYNSRTILTLRVTPRPGPAQPHVKTRLTDCANPSWSLSRGGGLAGAVAEPKNVLQS